MSTKSDPRPGRVDIETIRGYFSDPRTVDHYVRAVANIGLWNTERRVFEERIERENLVLDLGCGAGRIAIGLWEMGYRNVAGADLSQEMVAESRAIAPRSRSRDSVHCRGRYQFEFRGPGVRCDRLWIERFNADPRLGVSTPGIEGNMEGVSPKGRFHFHNAGSKGFPL